MGMKIEQILNRFHGVVADPGEYARNWQSQNKGSVVGYFCSYAPEEIILASGALPYRIFGSGKAVTLADAHLQAYSCSLVRGAMEDVLAGHLDFLKGTVFPHTCDSIQRLSDMWRMNTDLDFHLDVVLPVRLDTGSAGVYMVDVLKKFRADLGQALGVDISDDSLKAATEILNAMRTHMRSLYRMRSINPELISSSDLFAIIKASMMMDRKEVLDLLTELNNRLSDTDASDVVTKKRIVLAGGLCSMPDLFQIIETSGAVVVNDDLCTGSRYFEGDIRSDGDLVEAISQRYMERVVCPAKHAGLHTRGENLVRLAKENQADGIIFLFLKFCDPHAFDYPYMKEMIDKEGIPNMLIEIEDSSLSDGQLRTRCEAFVEML